jgi:hypothetical protein
MAANEVGIWAGGLQITQPPASGQLLVGNGVDFTLTNSNITWGNPIVINVPVTASQGITITTGGLTLSSPPGSSQIITFADGTTQSTAAVSPPSTITDFISGLIPVPTNQNYNIVINIPIGATITQTSTISTSGTCTATFYINTTPLGGAANSVSSTLNTVTQSSANVVAVGNSINMTVSSNSSCANLAFTIKYTRSLS